MSGLIFRRQLLLAKVETTTGTDAVPTPLLDAILVANTTFAVEVQTLERNIYLPDISNVPNRAGRKTITISFDAEIKGSGVAGQAPQIGALLMGCGFAETELAAGAGFRYDPVSSAFPSLTLYLYMDGILHKCLGSRGSVTINGTAGEYALATFTFQGSYVDPADAVMPTNAVYEPSIPPIVENALMSVDGYADCASEFTIDIANTINPRLCVNAEEGVSGFILSDRDVTGSYNPEASLMATYDPYDVLQSGEVVPYTVTLGDEPNNICTITGNVQYTNVSPGDREGALMWDIPLRFVRTLGNDEIRFTFPQVP